ncbi:hypothetical protein HMPREF0531_11358 [Lactiplantibacillus plantarum subsp. plantarum ATCC 14917 = JCM 1149 = CGMCC 1.2437]|nr:hypothetical protein HMPREF0531_11358 [Lactiplantibacillus plantarum subsp. plantarum ATCC 14917 = JCM 1149 = CGMCC 1.2437]
MLHLHFIAIWIAGYRNRCSNSSWNFRYFGCCVETQAKVGRTATNLLLTES